MIKRFDWISADAHLSHTNIIEYCEERQNLPGVSEVRLGDPLQYNVTAMNEALIDRWNEVVAPDDDALILGDLCMGKIADTLPLVEFLNGHKTLLLGNHDRPFGLHGSSVPKRQREWARWSAEYEKVGLTLITNDWFDMVINGHKVRVSHFPYTGDSHDEDRYSDHRPPDTGLILLHGHVHDAWKIQGRMLNVGVDVHDYYPVAESEIIRLIEEIENA